MKKPLARKDRRSFLGTAGAAVAAGFWADETLEALPQNVNTNSKPSQLKITDLRIAMVSKGSSAGIPVIRIETNQGIHGLPGDGR